MNKRREVLILRAGLFPDQDMLVTALESGATINIKSLETGSQEMGKAAWRKILGKIMDADVTIVL